MATQTSSDKSIREKNALRFNMIVAVDDKMGIGVDLNLPWKLPTDRKFYLSKVNTVSPNKKIAVIIGRKTQTVSRQERGPHKVFIVLSKTLKQAPPGVDYVCQDLEEALGILEGPELIDVLESVWIVGGYGVYKAGMASPRCHRFYVTRVHGDFNCNAFCPEVDMGMYQLVRDPDVNSEVQEENGIKFHFEVFERIR